MQTLGRRPRRILLVGVALAVLLGVNVPPTYSFVVGYEHEQLINSLPYEQQFGRWDTVEVPPDQRVNAMHGAVLRDGKVLLIAGSGNKENMFASHALKSLLYDPVTGVSRMIPVPDDMFCGGQLILPDGKLLVAGGTQRYEKLDGAVTNAAGAMRVKNESPNGPPRTLPQGTEFVSPDGRRYRSANDVTVPPAVKTPTPGGRTGPARGVTVTASEQTVFVEAETPGPEAVTNVPGNYRISGLSPVDAPVVRDADPDGRRKGPDPGGPRRCRARPQRQNEVFDPATKTWTERKDLTRYFPTYPAVFQTTRPNQMFYTGANAGYGPATQGRVPGLWDLSNNAFVPVPGIRDPDLLETAGSAWLGPVQDQRMAVVGGGGVGESPRSSARIDVADLKDPSVHFTPGPMLPEGTRYPNLVTLPDDTMLITNGSGDYRAKGASNNHIARLYHPDTNTLDVAADPAIGRTYHSEALLLPDGRVLVAGSDPLFNDVEDVVPGTFEQRIEIYSPPYLFRGPRPQITGGPPVVPRGARAELATPQAASIRSARLVRPMTATHVTSIDQRSVALPITNGPGAVSVTLPPDPATVPSGHWMLYLVDDHGIPSPARFVDVP